MERGRKLFNNSAGSQANTIMDSDDLGAFHSASCLRIFTSDKMKWILGSEKRPLGEAIIYCKQPSGSYITAMCNAIKREGFYDQLNQNDLESVIETAKRREIDVIDLGERSAKENCVELVLIEIGKYQILYNQQPENVKKASSRLPVITD